MYRRRSRKGVDYCQEIFRAQAEPTPDLHACQLSFSWSRCNIVCYGSSFIVDVDVGVCSHARLLKVQIPRPIRRISTPTQLKTKKPTPRHDNNLPCLRASLYRFIFATPSLRVHTLAYSIPRLRPYNCIFSHDRHADATIATSASRIAPLPCQRECTCNSKKKEYHVADLLKPSTACARLS